MIKSRISLFLSIAIVSSIMKVHAFHMVCESFIADGLTLTPSKAIPIETVEAFLKNIKVQTRNIHSCLPSDNTSAHMSTPIEENVFKVAPYSDDFKNFLEDEQLYFYVSHINELESIFKRKIPLNSSSQILDVYKRPQPQYQLSVGTILISAKVKKNAK